MKESTKEKISTFLLGLLLVIILCGKPVLREAPSVGFILSFIIGYFIRSLEGIKEKL